MFFLKIHYSYFSVVVPEKKNLWLLGGKVFKVIIYVVCKIILIFFSPQ